MQYVMMPLDAHYDSGFGAVAESFREAGKALREMQAKPAFFQHLPQTFLFRHAVELFLKSEIIIIHPKLRLAYGKEPYDGQPMILEGSKWKPMYRIHSISSLYSYWRGLIDPRLAELKDLTKHKADWDVLEGADDWIKTIEGVDPASTYSRYPSMRDVVEDRSKSPFKETAQEDMFPADSTRQRFVMALIVEN